MKAMAVKASLKTLLAQIKKRLGRLGQKGYTLTEMTAVVATAGVLTAVVLPVAVSQVQGSRIIAAQGDVNAIGAAISGFLKETGDYPMRSGNSNTFTVRYAKTILFSTEPDGTTTRDPDFAKLGVVGTTDLTARDTFEIHFFTNKSGSTTFYSTTGELQWKGPYISKRGLDPWGKSYLIYMQGIRDAADPDAAAADKGKTDKNILVISAGPNGVVETLPTDNSAKGDDIVTVLGRRT